MYFNAIRENKILAKNSEFTVFLKLFGTLIMPILTYSSAICFSDFKTDLLDNSYQFEKVHIRKLQIYTWCKQKNKQFLYVQFRQISYINCHTQTSM